MPKSFECEACLKEDLPVNRHYLVEDDDIYEVCRNCANKPPKATVHKIKENRIERLKTAYEQEA